MFVNKQNVVEDKAYPLFCVGRLLGDILSRVSVQLLTNTSYCSARPGHLYTPCVARETGLYGNIPSYTGIVGDNFTEIRAFALTSNKYI